MFRHLLFAVPALLLATSCTRTPPMQVVLDIPPVTRAPDLLKRLDLNVPKDVAHTSLRELGDVAASDHGAPAFLAQTQSADDAARAIECLTAAVYYEARSEPDDGERAVAQVVLNRVRDPAFPSSVCGVVYQGSHRATGCQFSFTCNGSMDRPIEPNAWARARAVATAALAGIVYDPVGSATFYHANYVSPWWAGSMTQVASIGAHIFYRWRGAMERALAFRQDYSGVESLPARGVAPNLAAAQTEGVAPSSAVNGGIQVVGPVTIHRIATESAAVVAAPPPGDAAVAGVRVHRGQIGPAVVTPAMAESDPAPSPKHIKVSEGLSAT